VSWQSPHTTKEELEQQFKGLFKKTFMVEA
jgi:hypothetical protein